MFKLRKEDYVVPDDGVYAAEVSKVEAFVSEKHPEFGTSIKFVFKILEEPYVGTNVNGLVNATWKPGNKLDKWLRALGLESAEIGTEIDPEALRGRRAQITLERNPKTDFVNVKAVHPLRTTPANVSLNAGYVAPVNNPSPVVAQSQWTPPAQPAPVAAPQWTPPPTAPAAPPVVPQAPMAPRPRPNSMPF